VRGSDIAIQTQGISRVYQTYVKPEGLWGSIRGFWDRQHQEKVALHPTTLTVPKGQIVGLVGANGAGKTTLLKVLSGLVHPSVGDANVLGFRPWERNPEFLKRMSILLGQKNQLWWDLTPRDSFQLLGEIYDLDREKTKRRVTDLAEMLACTHVLDTQLRRLSLGERMKMEIIGSLLHEPEVLFLDEPTIGLDIVAQTSIRRFLAEYVREKGPTVILTSHYMDDIAKLADRLLLISQGRIVYDGTLNEFIQKSDTKKVVKFSVAEPLPVAMTLMTGRSLAAGEQNFAVEVVEQELAPILAQVTALSGVSNLQIEERDFEDVIREFLEKDARIASDKKSVLRPTL
jgi:ABC-2 type transport system ATP-binding protein